MQYDRIFPVAMLGELHIPPFCCEPGDANTGLESCAFIMAGVPSRGLRLAGRTGEVAARGQGLSWPEAVCGCLLEYAAGEGFTVITWSGKRRAYC